MGIREGNKERERGVKEESYTGVLREQKGERKAFRMTKRVREK